MSGFWTQADDILRGGSWAIAPDRAARALRRLLLFVILFGLAYGAVMGTYAGAGGTRGLQMLYSALKVPLLLLITFAISLPSFFVLNSPLGVRDDFAQSLRALMATQAGLTIMLASLAPFVWLWYASVEHYHAAVLFNGLMFGAASVAAQQLLRRYYKPLIDRNPVHRHLLRAWLLIFAFVGIQMGWVLRPFIGAPDQPTRFFREGAWGNAYVEVGRMVWGVVAG